jgi:dsDNA-specific endonuclease/ATPase MutS2
MKLEEIIKKHLNKVVKENESTENYMFFSNIQQIHRQCEMLMKMNPQELDQIIKNGHDWADDHVSEAKNNMDQVFDFFMNETKRGESDMNESSSPAQQAAIAINMKKEGKKPKNESYGEIDESKNCPTDPAKWSASKAAAKAKFDVYPSAYANGWAAKNYKAKGGGWKKCSK